MSADGLVGMQAGDEGKGKITDYLAQSGEYDIVARGNGGPNAGHTLFIPGDILSLSGDVEIPLHLLPSGIATPGVMNLVGPGAYVSAPKLLQEMELLEGHGIEVSPENLLLSSSAQLILPHHRLWDILRECGPDPRGSTANGMAYALPECSLEFCPCEQFWACLLSPLDCVLLFSLPLFGFQWSSLHVLCRGRPF